MAKKESTKKPELPLKKFQRIIDGKKVVVEATSLEEASEKFDKLK